MWFLSDPRNAQRVLRVAVAAVALAFVATACTGGGTSTATPSPSGSGKPPSLEVLAQNVTITSGAAAAVRIGFRPADPTVRVIVTFPDTGSIIGVCGLANATDPVPASLGLGCIEEIPSGVREEIARLDGLGGIAMWVRDGRSVQANVRLEYSEAARDITVRIPTLEAPGLAVECKDNACNPFIEIRPVRGGRFTARATWTGERARFALLEGRILGKSYTATGIPYAVPAETEGGSGLSLDARLSAPAEYALVIDRNAGVLSDLFIESHWP